MITPLFSRRYKDSSLLLYGIEPSDIEKILIQISLIFQEDILPLLQEGHLMKIIYTKSEKLFTREVGWEKFSYTDNSAENRCNLFISEKTQTWHYRLSLIEILLREFDGCFRPEIISNNKTNRYKVRFSSGKTDQEIENDRNKFYKNAIGEINDRLADIKMTIFYKNGYFMPTEDNLTTDLIKKPFWDYINNKHNCENIENEMLEAVEAYNQNIFNEACRKAFMALESALKITIDDSDNVTFANLVDKTPEKI